MPKIRRGVEKTWMKGKFNMMNPRMNKITHVSLRFRYLITLVIILCPIGQLHSVQNIINVISCRPGCIQINQFSFTDSRRLEFILLPVKQFPSAVGKLVGLADAGVKPLSCEFV